MEELSFDLTAPIKLYPGSKNLEHLVKCIVNGMSLQKAMTNMMEKLCPDVYNLSINNIENEQKILDWLRPFFFKEKENIKQKLMEEIEHLEFMAVNVSDDLKKSKDELMKLESLEI